MAEASSILCTDETTPDIHHVGNSRIRQEVGGPECVVQRCGVSAIIEVISKSGVWGLIKATATTSRRKDKVLFSHEQVKTWRATTTA